MEDSITNEKDADRIMRCARNILFIDTDSLKAVKSQPKRRGTGNLSSLYSYDTTGVRQWTRIESSESQRDYK